MPSPDFEAAAQWLSTSPSASSQSNTTKLEIYGLYKFVTVSPRPKPGTRPGIFDWTGSAKWDAWDDAGKKFDSVSAAEARYIEIARSLGWPGRVEREERPKPTVAEEDDVDLDNLSDDEVNVPSHKAGNTSMGIRVSSLENPDEDEDSEDSLHGYAITGDEGKLRALLTSASGVDINSRDKYGFTPLHLASDRGHTGMVRLLLSAGARTELRTEIEGEDEDDSEGETALELAQAAGHDDIAELLSSHAVKREHIS